jgi:hypothetical protein
VLRCQCPIQLRRIRLTNLLSVGRFVFADAAELAYAVLPEPANSDAPRGAFKCKCRLHTVRDQRRARLRLWARQQAAVRPRSHTARLYRTLAVAPAGPIRDSPAAQVSELIDASRMRSVRECEQIRACHACDVSTLAVHRGYSLEASAPPGNPQGALAAPRAMSTPTYESDIFLTCACIRRRRGEGDAAGAAPRNFM